METIETIMMNRINQNKIFFCSKKMQQVNLNNCSVCKCRSNCNSRISLFGNVSIITPTLDQSKLKLCLTKKGKKLLSEHKIDYKQFVNEEIKQKGAQ